MPGTAQQQTLGHTLSPEVLAKALERGADRVMAKPFDNDALEEAVVALLMAEDSPEQGAS